MNIRAAITEAYNKATNPSPLTEDADWDAPMTQGDLEQWERERDRLIELHDLLDVVSHPA